MTVNNSLKNTGDTFRSIEYIVKIGFGIMLWILDPNRFQENGIEGVLREYFVWIQLSISIGIIISIISQAARNIATKEGKERSEQIITLTKQLVLLQQDTLLEKGEQKKLERQSYETHVEYLKEVKELNIQFTKSTREATKIMENFNHLKASMNDNLKSFIGSIDNVKKRVTDVETRFEKNLLIVKKDIKQIKKDISILKGIKNVDKSN